MPFKHASNALESLNTKPSNSKSEQDSTTEVPPTPGPRKFFKKTTTFMKIPVNRAIEKFAKVTSSAIPAIIRVGNTTFEMIQPSQAAETQFFWFEKLPYDIKKKIWVYSLPGPRVVSIKPDPRGIAFSNIGGIYRMRTSYVLQHLNPSILSVCHESQEIALSIYRDLNHINHFTKFKPIYTNDEIDALLISDSNIANWLFESILKSIRMRHRHLEIYSFNPRTTTASFADVPPITAPTIIWDSQKPGPSDAAALAEFIKRMRDIKTPSMKLLLVLPTPEGCWNTPGWLEAKSQEERLDIARESLGPHYDFLQESRYAYGHVTLISVGEIEKRFHGMEAGAKLL